jgi:hypothetical protein
MLRERKKRLKTIRHTHLSLSLSLSRSLVVCFINDVVGLMMMMRREGDDAWDEKR